MLRITPKLYKPSDIEPRRCFKCGTIQGRIVKHHLNYKTDETVDCCWDCHQKLHPRIRRLNNCPLTPKEIARLSIISSEKRYIKRAIRSYVFQEYFGSHFYLREKIVYNQLTGNVCVTSGIYWR